MPQAEYLTPISSYDLKDAPRQGMGAETPGDYVLVLRAHEEVLDAGDTLVFDGFISGYGAIEAAKLILVPSSKLIADAQAEVTFNVIQLPSEGGQRSEPGYGGHPAIFRLGDGVVFGLDGGVNNPEWPRPTYVWDKSLGDAPVVSSERVLGAAPIHGRLKLADRAKPGTYKLLANFCYFDGQVWRSKPAELVFSIRNVFQRYDGLITALGVAAAIATIAPFLSDIVCKLAF